MSPSVGVIVVVGGTRSTKSKFIPSNTSSNDSGYAKSHSVLSLCTPPSGRCTLRVFVDERSEIYFRSKRMNGNPKQWSPCQCVKRIVSISAGLILLCLRLASAVGGQSMRALLSISNNGTDGDPRELLLWRGSAELPDGPVVAPAPIDRP